MCPWRDRRVRPCRRIAVTADPEPSPMKRTSPLLRSAAVITGKTLSVLPAAVKIPVLGVGVILRAGAPEGVSSDNQHPPVRKQNGEVFPACGCHVSGSGERARHWIVELRAGQTASACDQDLPVGEQGGGVAISSAVIFPVAVNVPGVCPTALAVQAASPSRNRQKRK